MRIIAKAYWVPGKMAWTNQVRGIASIHDYDLPPSTRS
jgi:hypothetical protein